MEKWPFTSEERRLNELQWFRLASIAYSSISPEELPEGVALTGIDFKAITRDGFWHIPMFFASTNSEPRAAGVTRRGVKIELSLRDR
jgi:hypothetical protein